MICVQNLLTNLNSLLYILVTAIILFSLYRLRWIIMEGIAKPAKWLADLIGKGIEALARTCQSVWLWICGPAVAKPTDQPPDNPENKLDIGAKYPLTGVVAGLLALLLAVGACWGEFQLLKLSWEIAFPGLEEATGSWDWTAVLAVVMLMGVTVSGALWRDAKHFVDDENKAGEMAKWGFGGVIAMIIASVFLAMLQALVITESNVVISVVRGLITGAIALVVAIAASIAFCNLLYPLGQRIVLGIEKYFPGIVSVISGIVTAIGRTIKFVIGLVCWIGLASLIIIMVIAYVITQLPAFLLELKKLYEEWGENSRRQKFADWDDRENRRIKTIQNRGREQATRIENDETIRRTRYQDREKAKRVQRIEKRKSRILIQRLKQDLSLEELNLLLGEEQAPAEEPSNDGHKPDEMNASIIFSPGKGGENNV